jgi:hypothetical protein
MKIDLAHLEALAKAAGSAAWSTACGPDGTFDGKHVWGPDGDSVCRVFGNIGNWPEPIDEAQIAAHIEANSPKAVLELCAEVRRLRESVDKLLAHCPDPECFTCGEAVCPHGEPLHFHHDGCPSCCESGE